MSEEADEVPWAPLSVREAGGTVAWNVLHDDVPDHLRPSLLSIFLHGLKDGREADAMERRLQRAVTIDGEVPGSRAGLYALAQASDEDLLNMVDYLLLRAGERFWQAQEVPRGTAQRTDTEAEVVRFVEHLQRVLREANSTWRADVHTDPGRRWALVHRVDETATAAANHAAQQRKQPGSLLASAWAATFKRDPDLSRAYTDAVLAVEAAATPVLIPNNTRPTLGRAIDHLKDTQDKWTVAGLDDQSQKSSATLLGMLRTLWQNHGRHVAQGGHPPDPVSQDEAEAVVFLAVTLVQWFERGLVRRID